MATVFTTQGSTYGTYDGRYLYLTINETTNAKTNKSTLAWTLTVTGGSTANYSTGATTVKINGTTVYSKARTEWDERVFPASKGSVSGTIDVTHDADGSKSITVEFKTVVYYGEWGITDYGGTMTLTKIDRAAPTVSITTSNITASGVTVKATASATCDRWEYSINNGSSWTQYSTTSGTTQSKAITGLTPNTAYNIKVRARKSSNEVWGTSAAASITTLGGSVISSVNTFTADNATAKIVMSVTVYNVSYTHTLVLKNGSTTVLTISSLSLTNGSNEITLTSAQRSTVLSAMASIKSFTGTFELKTYSGGTQIGTASTKTATVQTTAANSAPTFSSFTYQDTNAAAVAVTSNNQILIQDVSTLAITAAAATAKNGASISSYSAVAGSKTASSTTTSINVGTISDSGTVAIVVTAIDSRGYTTSVTVNITVIAYAAITLTNYSARRVNEVEDTIQTAISGTMKPVTIGGVNKNSLKYVRYRYKKTSDGSYSAWVNVTSSATSTDTSFSFSNNELVDLDANYSYYVQFRVDDQLTYDTVTLTIAQGTPLMSFRRQKVGINQRTPAAALDVSGNIQMNGYNVQGFVLALGSSEDFNNLTSPGIYTQALNANASTSRHYPANIAGYLEVFTNPSGYVLQRYTAYDCSGMYIRYRYNNSWNTWKSITIT